MKVLRVIAAMALAIIACAHTAWAQPTTLGTTPLAQSQPENALTFTVSEDQAKVLRSHDPSTWPNKVCLGVGATLCVPLSVLRATFRDWQDGDISPLAKEQAAHADTYARWRNAEHELAKVRAELMKLSAPKEAEGLDQVRAAWLKSVQDAAPPGTVFDEKTGKYVPKPPAEKPKGGGTP